MRMTPTIIMDEIKIRITKMVNVVTGADDLSLSKS